MSKPDNSDAAMYVRSLKGADKRKFGMNYLAWLQGGKAGSMPSRGYLSPIIAKAVTANLEARV